MRRYTMHTGDPPARVPRVGQSPGLSDLPSGALEGRGFRVLRDATKGTAFGIRRLL